MSTNLALVYLGQNPGAEKDCHLSVHPLNSPRKGITIKVKVWVKGQKEAYATYGDMTAKYLDTWLAEFQPDGNIWGLGQWGIISMLRRLKEKTGITCNPHVFRRSFACLLREKGLNTLAIKDLGRWETTTMVEHYTRSMDFHDSLKFYKGPLSEYPET